MTIHSTKHIFRIIFILTCILFIQSCASVKPAIKTPTPKKISHKLKSNMPAQYANFDRKAFPKDALVISNMITIVQPELDEDDRDIIATQISSAIKKFNVEPQIIVAIIDTESDFKADKISTTGDLSVAQINVDVWNREFIRMKKGPILKERVQSDQEYALLKMVEILNILKTRYQKKDRRWYARYHSNTHRYKRDYLHKLEIRLKMLAISNDLVPKSKIVAQTN